MNQEFWCFFFLKLKQGFILWCQSTCMQVAPKTNNKHQFPTNSVSIKASLPQIIKIFHNITKYCLYIDTGYSLKLTSYKWARCLFGGPDPAVLGNYSWLRTGLGEILNNDTGC